MKTKPTNQLLEGCFLRGELNTLLCLASDESLHLDAGGHGILVAEIDQRARVARLKQQIARSE
jgi:Flp pilus assembly CpaE family ATPase